MNCSTLEFSDLHTGQAKGMFAWLNTYATLIGSRAVEVDIEDSDYDFALTGHLYNCFCKEFPNSLQKLNAANYLKTLPLGNTYLVRTMLDGNKIDLIIYPTDEDMSVVLDCIEVMQLFIPRELLLVKQLRVDIFMQLLINRGFNDVRGS